MLCYESNANIEELNGLALYRFIVMKPQYKTLQNLFVYMYNKGCSVCFKFAAEFFVQYAFVCMAIGNLIDCYHNVKFRAIAK